MPETEWAAATKTGTGPAKGSVGTLAKLRRNGLDVALVIKGTGAMKPIIDDVKAKIEPLAQAVHRLVPIARIGIVVFGGKGEAMQFQPLTLSPQKLDTFLNIIQRMGGRESEEDTYGACQTAINKMDWKPYARKVIVLVGDSPPPKDDFAPLLTMIRQFKSNNGTFSTVDVAAEEQDGEVDHEERPEKLTLARVLLADAGGLQSAGLGRWRLDEITHQGHAHRSAAADPDLRRAVAVAGFCVRRRAEQSQLESRSISQGPTPAVQIAGGIAGIRC